MKRTFALCLFFCLHLNIIYSQSKCDTITFHSHGAKVVGYFYSSHHPKSMTLIFTQGFMETGDIWGVGNFLSTKGINVFMFDFRGCFQSEGKQGLMNSQEDIGSVLGFIKSEVMIDKYQIDTTKIILGGYSYGGHMSLLYAINHPEIKRIISISGGDLGILGNLVKSNPDLKNGYSEFFKSIKKPNGPVIFEYEDPIQELIDNHDYFSIFNQTDKLSNVEILLVGGLDDSVVNMEDYILPMYRNLKKNRTIRTDCEIYQTGHSYKKVSDELLRDIEKWINKK